MAGSKPGERRGGREKGVPNKATVARERAALEALQQKAKTTVLKTLAKDKLAGLVDEALDVVAAYKKAACRAFPGQKAYNPKMWAGFMQAIDLARRVADAAADYESPKFRAIAVVVPPGDDNQPGDGMPAIAPADELGREHAANASYLRLVKGRSS